MLGFDNISVSSMAHQDNMQMYKDAMRLGASITKLVTSFKNMQVRYKQRSFDMWKVSTILKETNRHRETTNNFNETWRTTSSYQSDCIQILQLTRPVMIKKMTTQQNNSLTESSIASVDEVSPTRRQPLMTQISHQAKEMKLKKAVCVISRFKARKLMNSYFNWKYQVIS